MTDRCESNSVSAELTGTDDGVGPVCFEVGGGGGGGDTGF